MKDLVRNIDDKIDLLIVDDDTMLCDLLEETLSQDEHLRVNAAHNGIEAIEKIKEKNYDLILTDLMMPGANGMEVLHTAKELIEGVHVIIITGFASLETAMEAIRNGAYDYITKPFKLDEIKVVVQNACEKIKLVRQNQALIENLTQAYQDLDALKNSREELNARVEKITKRMNEHQEKIVENIIGLQTPPASHYLRRRRTDKGYILIELEKLGKLRDEGILSEEEFLFCKNRFLREL